MYMHTTHLLPFHATNFYRYFSYLYSITYEYHSRNQFYYKKKRRLQVKTVVVHEYVSVEVHCLKLHLKMVNETLA